MIHELLEGILPTSQVSILAGASGAGKTTLVLQMLKELAAGNESFWGHAAQQPLRLGYVVGDRTKEDLLHTAGDLGFPNMQGVPVRSLIDDVSIDMHAFEQAPLGVLFSMMQSLLPCDLIVVDPLMVFTGVDTNKYHLNAAKLIRINRWCMEHKVTLLGTHHATKARSDFSFMRAQDRISGSSALQGYTSTQLFLASPEETGNKDSLFEWTIVSHHAAPKTMFLARPGVGFVPVGVKENIPRESIDVRVLDALNKAGALRTGDLVDLLAPVSRSTIYRLLDRMELSGLIVKTARGLYRIAASGDHPES